MRLALLGPPGAGKGTQAARICDAFGLLHFSSGDLLRAEKLKKTPEGQKIRDYIDTGRFVPDELMLGIIRSKLLSIAKQGFVLDGFPRTLSQARALTEFLTEMNRPLSLVIDLAVDPAVLSRRFEGRRVCPVCLSVYHVDLMPPQREGICDHDGAGLVIRPDDMPAVVRTRIDTYRQTISPLLDYYRQAGLLWKVDASGSVDDVWAQIEARLSQPDMRGSSTA
ncbi:MAG: adenylate kinase [Phycisphaerae bacterium]